MQVINIAPEFPSGKSSSQPEWLEALRHTLGKWKLRDIKFLVITLNHKDHNDAQLVGIRFQPRARDKPITQLTAGDIYILKDQEC